MADLRSGRRYRKISQDFIARARAANAPCWLCGERIDYQARGRTPLSPELDHARPVTTHPHLCYEPSNFRIAHASCNHRRGAKTPASYRRRQSQQRGGWVAAAW